MIAMRIKSDANVPRKNCPDRVLHCHSSCEKYKAYRAILEQNNCDQCKYTTVKCVELPIPEDEE